LDRATGILYLWPPSALTAASDIIVSLLGAPLVRMNGVGFVTLRDFTLETTRNELVDVRSGTNVKLEGLVLRDAGTDAASVGGTANVVRQCEVYGSGEAGIVLSGGDRPSLTRSDSVVESSNIHDIRPFRFDLQSGDSVDRCRTISAAP